MSFYRTHVLTKVQDMHGCGGGLSVLTVQKATFDALEARHDGGDKTAKHFLGELEHLAGLIEGPDDHDRWNHFFEIYQEAVFYLIARERGLFIEVLKDNASAPDFVCRAPPTCRFEVKTLNVKDGPLAQDQTLLDGLAANLEAKDMAKRTGTGWSVHVAKPHGAGATAFDATRQVLEKIAGNRKSSQFQVYPTYLVVCLDRVAPPISSEPLEQVCADPDLGCNLSGTLWHIAWGQVADDFTYEEVVVDDQGIESLAIKTAPFGRDGILEAFPSVAGIVFLETLWEKLPEMDGAFRHCAYRLHGFRRVAATADEHKHFDQICDAWKVGR